MDWPAPDDLPILDEHFLDARTPDGRIAVQVSWLPPHDPHGHFHCKVVIDGDAVVEDLQTRDPQRMYQWVVKEMREAMRRSHKPKALA